MHSTYCRALPCFPSALTHSGVLGGTQRSCAGDQLLQPNCSRCPRGRVRVSYREEPMHLSTGT